MWIKRKDYIKLKNTEKQYRQLKNSNECANAYARYQEDQMEWWKKSYYELEKEKDDEIIDLRVRILNLEFELESVKDTAFKMQKELIKGE